MAKPLIAITLGDPGGIGSEVIVKSLQNFQPSPKFSYAVIGTREPFDFLKKKFRLNLPSFIDFWDITAEAKTSSGFDSGKVSLRNARIAFAALKVAAENAAKGRIAAIVTAPVNKTAMRLVDPNFHGHTEYLAQTSRRKQFAMMFVSDRLKVTLVTIHVPIRKVSSLIQRKSVFEKIFLTDSFLKRYFRLKEPKIAVCALNPHGRETGEEDEAEIAPAVQKARRKKIHAIGPLSADQVFHDAYEGRFDAVISMYHDQGLAPFKMIAFQEGVNVTLGLPYIRTSPDHGTAYDIAYQGKARPESMGSALRLAEKLFGGK